MNMLRKPVTSGPNRQTVVVLGAAGFVGRHVAREMNACGFAVIGIGHGSWTADEAREWGIEVWMKDDISLPALERMALTEPPKAVIHCGGSGVVSYSYVNPLDDFQRSAQSTVATLEWIRLHGKGQCRLVLVSSAAVYGDRGDTDATESSAPAPISPYGFHKVIAETLCDSYSRFFDTPVSIVRLFSVYGEGLRKQLLWDAMCKFREGQCAFFGTGHELRDWIHVDDAARLLCAAALTPQSRLEIYNGGHNQATTREVLTLLAQAAATVMTPQFNGEVHKGNPRRLTADCEHTRRLLGWAPQVGLAQGLQRYAAWFARSTDANRFCA